MGTPLQSWGHSRFRLLNIWIILAKFHIPSFNRLGGDVLTRSRKKTKKGKKHTVTGTGPAEYSGPWGGQDKKGYLNSLGLTKAYHMLYILLTQLLNVSDWNQANLYDCYALASNPYYSIPVSDCFLLLLFLKNGEQNSPWQLELEILNCADIRFF